MRDSIKSIRPRKTAFDYALKRDNNFNNQKNIYVVENEEGVFLYRKANTRKFSIAIECRRRNCRKRLRLNPILNVR